MQTIFNLETPLPPITIIATIDVKSLYTNIPHNEGINVLASLDTTHERMWPFRKIIYQFLKYILMENYFTFQPDCRSSMAVFDEISGADKAQIVGAGAENSC